MAVLDEYQHVDPTKLIERLLKIPIALQFFTQFCKERCVSRIGLVHLSCACCRSPMLTIKVVHEPVLTCILKSHVDIEMPTIYTRKGVPGRPGKLNWVLWLVWDSDAYRYLAFYLDAEEFRKHLPGHHSFRKSQAKKLFNKYLADDAVMRVSTVIHIFSGNFSWLVCERVGHS